MEIFQIIVTVAFFLCCIVLVFLILIQSGKGGSLGIFGGAGSSTPFGTSTVDVVTKATWWGAGFFFLLAILAAILFARAGVELPENLPAETSKTTTIPTPSTTTGESEPKAKGPGPDGGNKPPLKAPPANP